MAKIKPQALLQQSKNKKGPTRISITSIVLRSLVVLLIVFFLFRAYRHWSERSQIPSHSNRSVLEDNTLLDHKKSGLPQYVTLNTGKGSVIVELFKDSFPGIIDEFIKLCQKGHFKGMLFHHVIKHYVIHAANTDKPSIVEDWTLKGKNYDQLDKSLKHEAFMVGTPKAKNERGGFELYITTAPIPELNEKLIVFGRVAKGEDVIQDIEEIDTDENFRPKSPIGITDVTLHHEM